MADPCVCPSRSDLEIERWSEIKERYIQKGKVDEFYQRLAQYKASLSLGRDFGESGDHYRMRMDLEKFWNYKF